MGKTARLHGTKTSGWYFYSALDVLHLSPGPGNSVSRACRPRSDFSRKAGGIGSTGRWGRGLYRRKARELTYVRHSTNPRPPGLHSPANRLATRDSPQSPQRGTWPRNRHRS